MAEPIAVRMPPLSQTMDTLLLVEWLRREGERVEKGEALFLVESDKATLEVEAPASGVLLGPLAPAGVEMQVGAVLVQIAAASPDDTPADAPATAPALQPAPAPRIFASPRARVQAAAVGAPLAAIAPTGPEGMVVERDVVAWLQAQPASAAHAAPPESPARVSPVARRAAEAAGVDLGALAAGQPGRRLTRRDVEAAQPDAPPPPAAPASADSVSQAAVQRVPLSPLRRTLTARLQAGGAIPVTLNRAVDATDLVALRARLLADLPAGAEPPTFTDLFGWMTARTLLRHPALNGTVAADALLLHSAVHLALAVQTPRGLLAPVLRDAHRLGLLDFAARRAALVAAARAGQSAPVDLEGGTFTLTNLGPQRIDAFTPVINPPQIAILGVGRIRTVVAPYAGAPALRDEVILSLTFDHRATDGAPAAAFLDDLARWIESPHRIWFEPGPG